MSERLSGRVEWKTVDPPQIHSSYHNSQYSPGHQAVSCPMMGIIEFINHKKIWPISAGCPIPPLLFAEEAVCHCGILHKYFWWWRMAQQVQITGLFFSATNRLLLVVFAWFRSAHIVLRNIANILYVVLCWLVYLLSPQCIGQIISIARTAGAGQEQQWLCLINLSLCIFGRRN